MAKIISVAKNDTGKDRIYEAKLDTGEIKSFPAYSTVKKIIVSYGLISWLKKSNANTLSQDEIYKIIEANNAEGLDAVSNALYSAIYTGTGEDYAEDQRNIGSHIHWMIEQFLSGQEVPPQEELFQYAWNEFLNWTKGHKIEVLPEGLELELVSLEHRVGGTIDMVANIDGQLEVVDWKTSSSIFYDYAIQVACYRGLWNSSFPDNPIHNARIIRIPKREFNESLDKKTGKIRRSKNNLLELKLNQKQLDYFLDIFLKIRDIWELSTAATTYNKLQGFVDTIKE